MQKLFHRRDVFSELLERVRNGLGNTRSTVNQGAIEVKEDGLESGH